MTHTIYFQVILLSMICLHFSRTEGVPKSSSGCHPIFFPAVRVDVTPRCKDVRIAMNQCIGACESMDKNPLSEGNSVCRCCQPVDFRERTVVKEVACMSNDQAVTTLMSIKIYEPIRCECRNCRPS